MLFCHLQINLFSNHSFQQKNFQDYQQRVKYFDQDHAQTFVGLIWIQTVCIAKKSSLAGKDFNSLHAAAG